MTSIPYPRHRSEFEIQAWLFVKIRSQGIDARGECFSSKRVSNKGCRLICDLVLFEEKKPFRVIEVKSEFASKVSVRKYDRLGLPVDLVFGGDHENYFEWLLLNKYSKKEYGRDRETPKDTILKGPLCNCGKKRRGIWWNCKSCSRKMKRGEIDKCHKCPRALSSDVCLCQK